MTDTMSLSLKYKWENGGSFASNPEICGYGEEITREIEDAKKEVDKIEKLLMQKKAVLPPVYQDD